MRTWSRRRRRAAALGCVLARADHAAAELAAQRRGSDAWLARRGIRRHHPASNTRALTAAVRSRANGDESTLRRRASGTPGGTFAHSEIEGLNREGEGPAALDMGLRSASRFENRGRGCRDPPVLRARFARTYRATALGQSSGASGLREDAHRGRTAPRIVFPALIVERLTGHQGQLCLRLIVTRVRARDRSCRPRHTVPRDVICRSARSLPMVQRARAIRPRRAPFLGRDPARVLIGSRGGPRSASVLGQPPAIVAPSPSDARTAQDCATGHHLGAQPHHPCSLDIRHRGRGVSPLSCP